MNPEDPFQSLSRLTERERSALRLRCAGWELKDIAEKLVMGEAMVRREMANIYVKLGLDKLSKVERYKKLFEEFCPALRTADLQPREPEPEEPEPEGPEPEEPEPVSPEVEDMVEEDMGAIVEWQPMPLVAPPKEPGPRRWWPFLLGMILGVLVLAGIMYLLRGVLWTGGPPVDAGVATMPVQEAKPAAVEIEQVTVIVTATPGPPQHTQTPIVHTSAHTSLISCEKARNVM